MQFKFYSTTAPKIHKVVCVLLEKAYAAELKSLAIFSSKEECQLVNNLLWTYSQKQFIPHGSIDDPLPSRQPIYLISREDLINTQNQINNAFDHNSYKLLLLMNNFDILTQNYEAFERYQQIILVRDENYDTIKWQLVENFLSKLSSKTGIDRKDFEC